MTLVKQLEDSDRQRYTDEMIATGDSLRQGETLRMRATTWIIAAVKQLFLYRSQGITGHPNRPRMSRPDKKSAYNHASRIQFSAGYSLYPRRNQ